MTEAQMRNMPDLVAFLTDQHEQIKELMPKLLDSQREQRQELFSRFRRMLAVHEAFEQETVHLAAREEDDEDVARARIAEEKKAAEAITTLEDIDLDSDDFTERFTALQSYVVAHAEREEQDEFNQLTGDWTSDGMARIAVGMQLADQAVAAAGGALEGDTFKELFSYATQQIRDAGEQPAP